MSSKIVSRKLRKVTKKLTFYYWNFYIEEQIYRFLSKFKCLLHHFKGFGIYYVDSNDVIRCINFDLISIDLSQDANAAVRGFRILRTQEFFKEIEKKDYIVWADCGKHFRNCEILGYLLLELAEEDIHGRYTIKFKHSLLLLIYCITQNIIFFRNFILLYFQVN